MMDSREQTQIAFLVNALVRARGKKMILRIGKEEAMSDNVLSVVEKIEKLFDKKLSLKQISGRLLRSKNELVWYAGIAIKGSLECCEQEKK